MSKRGEVTSAPKPNARCFCSASLPFRFTASETVKITELDQISYFGNSKQNPKTYIQPKKSLFSLSCDICSCGMILHDFTELLYGSTKSKTCKYRSCLFYSC